MSGTVMAATIEGLDDMRRQRVQEEVIEWAKTPGAMHDLHGAIETARDGFAGRIKWAIAYVAKLELNQNLDDYFLEFFCSEINSRRPHSSLNPRIQTKPILTGECQSRRRPNRGRNPLNYSPLGCANKPSQLLYEADGKGYVKVLIEEELPQVIIYSSMCIAGQRRFLKRLLHLPRGTR